MANISRADLDYLNSPKFCRVMMVFFELDNTSKDKYVTIGNIVRAAFFVSAYDITKTAEYSYVRRLMIELESIKLVRCVKAKKGVSPTYFQLNSNVLSRMCINYIDFLPLTGSEWAPPKPISNEIKKSKSVHTLIKLFLKGAFHELSTTYSGDKLINDYFLSTVSIQDILLSFVRLFGSIWEFNDGLPPVKMGDSISDIKKFIYNLHYINNRFFLHKRLEDTYDKLYSMIECEDGKKDSYYSESLKDFKSWQEIQKFKPN